MLAAWPCPLPGGKTTDELAVVFAKERPHRVLLIPPLFDEHNKFRRQMVEIMRRLDHSGIDSALPDCPGWNESCAPLAEQSLTHWRSAIMAAASHFGSTHLLSFRAGALLAPPLLPGWLYAPTGGKQVLRGMLRARTLAAREAGMDEKTAELQEIARSKGIALAGWQVGAELFGELEQAEVTDNERHTVIQQGTVGGAGLWLRAEPDEDPEQADALAAFVAVGLSDV
mgnify:CR=1 FL=1